ncbi:PAS domain-containing protein [Massilia sp. PAMC28688]|uniref:PAS domain-containing protein n=1 Tax=Massilia sp. PAMC28688 TaxID=2861283 RepID=UPI001C62B7C8|nr:PAS domain-containing protein [Massilia sp. PAMC28688]QYF95480.1 PAS domain-containing protein [Massilia sp. PAMC28688]
MATELLLENTSDAVLCLSSDWRYEYVNRAAEMLLRRKRDSLLGRSHWDEYPTLLGTPAEEHLRTAMGRQSTVTFEQFIPGLYAWHSVTAVPNGGKLVLFCRDVTDRVRALREEAVREGVRSVLEHVPVAITVTRGPEHRIEMQNEFSRALIQGRNMEGSTVKSALPEAVEQGFIALLDQVFESRKAFVGTDMSLVYDADGSGTQRQAYFDLTYQPIFETDGRVSGILHMGVDVTERRREKDLLARYAAERDATLRQLSEGVIITDAGGRITLVNERAAHLHGVAVLDVPVDAYSATYQLLTLEGLPYPPSELPLARAVLHDEFVENARWRIRRPDGSEVTVEGSAQPVFDERQRKIACVLVMRPLH